MELDETKLEEVVEKIAYQQTAEDQADDLFNKMGILNEYVKEQLALHIVSQQRELLIALIKYYENKPLTIGLEEPELLVDKFLAINCE